MDNLPTRSLPVGSSDDSAGSLPPIVQSKAWYQELIQQKLLGPPTTPGGPVCIDRYPVEGLIGEGGMGLVFLARHPLSGAVVAIKIIKPQYVKDSRLRHQFLSEARHMSRLSHDNILKILDIWDRVAGPYYVTPFIKRGSLAKLLAKGRPLDVQTILRVSRGVAAALAYAHDKGLIHRDLKPDNILLDEGGNALLADFGMVRTLFNDSTMDVRETHRVGTPAYMSPAVAAGAAEDTRCDIYSFGATLYQMLTGRPPYSGASHQDVIKQILAGPPESILKVNPNAPLGLARIAQGAMARELRDRYAKMDDVLADLDRVQQGKQPIRRRVVEKRGWGIIGQAALLVALLVVLVAIATPLISRYSKRPSVAVPPANPGPEIEKHGPATFPNLTLARRFSFLPAMRYEATNRTVTQTFDTAVADFDGDGNPDVAVILESAVNIFFGKGDGSLIDPYVSIPEPAAAPIAVADYNGNGHPSIASSRVHRTGIDVSLNLSNGRSWKDVRYRDEVGYESLVAADFRHRGKPDIAGVSLTGVVTILLNKGDGTFLPPVHKTVAKNAFRIAAADMDHDGNLDLVLVFKSAYEKGDPPRLGCAVMRGDGRGGFSDPIRILNVALDARSSLAISDLNGDGFPDLIVRGRNRLIVLLSNADAARTLPYSEECYRPMQLGNEAHAFNGFAVADLDGDGIPDLAVADASEDRCVRILPGLGNGTFGPPIIFPLKNFLTISSKLGWGLSLADLNHDGKPDIILTDAADQSINILINSGQGWPNPKTTAVR